MTLNAPEEAPDIALRGASRWTLHRNNHFLWSLIWSSVAVVAIVVSIGALRWLGSTPAPDGLDLVPQVAQNVPAANVQAPAPEKVPPLPVFRPVTEDEMTLALRKVPETGLDTKTFSAMKLSRPKQGDHPLAIALANGDCGDAKGLPYTFGTDCRSSLDHARSLERSARALRVTIDSSKQGMESLRPYYGIETDARWLQVDKIPALMQMLMPEDASWRQTLIRMLRKIDGPEASVALANRAVFDSNLAVRTAAVDALRSRSSEEYADKLVAAFRHPWAPAANHAAQAIVALNLTGLTSQLQEMLDQPDPSAPTKRKIGIREQTVVPELVRVNHLKNCLLCHQVSTAKEDSVRGRVPDWDTPLPQSYYQVETGSFARADMVYLRQDFSAMMPVENHGPWPQDQRFDFLVRQRPATAEEIANYRPAATYPQREAVRFALDRLGQPDQVARARE
jgi:hypothetical protein